MSTKRVPETEDKGRRDARELQVSRIDQAIIETYDRAAGHVKTYERLVALAEDVLAGAPDLRRHPFDPGMTVDELRRCIREVKAQAYHNLLPRSRGRKEDMPLRSALLLGAKLGRGPDAVAKLLHGKEGLRGSRASVIEKVRQTRKRMRKRDQIFSTAEYKCRAAEIIRKFK